jgi:hexosaminidase
MKTLFMKYLLFFFVFVLVLISFNLCSNVERNEEVAIIPVPLKIKKKAGGFVISSKTRIYCSDKQDAVKAADYFIDFIKIPTGFNIEINKKPLDKDKIIFRIVDDSVLEDEGYKLDVTEDSVVISANKFAGLFYGVQTLLQLLPPEIFSMRYRHNVAWVVPGVTVFDKPEFKWRGMHLDVSRHFFEKDFIKRYLDLLAMHKMNVFHWHLTDNNGWRLEIKHYPELTDICAWRVDREYEPWRKRTPPTAGEKANYGGYYTQEDVKEIINYAAQRNIMVVPEIEMPGHSGEVFAAFPSLSCSGEKTYVSPGGWPAEDIFCAGNDSVFFFLQNVLDEVFELFPSPYVHIGGDEADKTTWKNCNKCQKRIRDEKLKDVDELQSWFVKRIENYVVAHGKKIIGWDEILQGGLAPEATVMSWRGIEGGIEAAKQKHDAIMTPVHYCYFDYYQANPKFEPEAIGGFTTLKKVYSYKPIPDEITKEEKNHILGAQGNVWTEFMLSPEKVEYMALPRMTALAEVLWSSPKLKDWNDFYDRLKLQFNRFDNMNVTYSEGSWHVDIVPQKDYKNNIILIELKSEKPDYTIYYTLDGTIPSSNSSKYEKPFVVDSTVTIKAALFKASLLQETFSEKTFYLHKAIGKDIFLINKPVKKYECEGALSLVDGMTGSNNYNDGYWMGFKGDNLDAMINLGHMTEIHSIKMDFYQRQSSWIFLPLRVTFKILDENKNVVVSKSVVPNKKTGDNSAFIKSVSVQFTGIKGYYVKVVAVNRKDCPVGHPGFGNLCWMFVDEIVVE